MRRPLIVVLPLVAALALTVAACGDDEPSAGSSTGSTATAANVETTEATEATTEALAPGECSTTAPEAKDVVRTFDQPPPREIDDTKTYTATLKTSCGDIVIRLDPKAAPNTVNNFVVLARKDYFDGLIFHRVVDDFVIQGGDPEGNGSGGPGYSFPDELPEAGAYKLGSLAMANSGPDTNGSQFFIVTGPNGATLPPNYSLFGQVTKGQEVAKTIEDREVEPGTEKPTPLVYILDVEIVES